MSREPSRRIPLPPSSIWLEHPSLETGGQIPYFDFTSTSETGSFGFGQASIHFQGGGGTNPPSATTAHQCQTNASGGMQRRSHQDSLQNDEPDDHHRRKLPRHEDRTRNRMYVFEGSSSIPKASASLSPTLPSQPQRHSQNTSSPAVCSQDSASLSGKRFACPFTKHHLGKNGTTMACLGSPGWPSIARMKEHIYRRHASDKYQCSRCLTKCESHSHLREHQRAEPPCAVKRKDQQLCGDKLDEIQLAEIKKKSSRKLTEVEKWNEIYRIIFRRSDDAEIPSAYCEDYMIPPNLADNSQSDSLSLFEEHLQTQIAAYGAEHPGITTMIACLDLIRGFRQQSSNSASLSISQVPSLGSYISDELLASHLIATTPPPRATIPTPATALQPNAGVLRHGPEERSCCPLDLNKEPPEAVGHVQPGSLDLDFDMVFDLDLPDVYRPER